MNKDILLASIITLVIGAGVGFFGGVTYQKNQQPSSRQFALGQGGSGRAFGNGSVNGARSGVRPINGQITSNDGKTMTVKEQNGSSIIVLLSANTTINKVDNAAQDELKVGSTISAFGVVNSDGSITAQNIQLNPVVRITPVSGTSGQ